MSKSQKIVGISLPKDVQEKLDRIRQDIPRSKFIVRMLEKKFSFEKEDQK